MPVDRKLCVKCGREKPEKDFFKQKDGERCDFCKDCLCENIDNNNPETFKWILEKFDVPYIEDKWIQLANNIYKKKGTLTNKSVIGTYIRSMNIRPFDQYTYADTDKLNFAQEKAKQEAAAAQAAKGYTEEELRGRLERGEISQAEYETLRPSTTDNKVQYMAPVVDEGLSVIDDLEPEDIQYLRLKWGHMYRPEQWLSMETMYNRYANEYEINVDREEVLKKMCKTSLKMDEAIDAGDTKSYKELAGVFDQLRKGGKFTEAQNKEKEEKYLDTIGELVRICEEHGGPIANNLPDPDKYPQDTIDYSIKDLKAYNFSLFSGEPHILDMMEAFMEKWDKAAEAQKKLEERENQGFILSNEDLERDSLTNEEMEEYEHFIEREKEADYQAMINEELELEEM